MNIDGVIGALIITAVPWAWLWCMEYRDQMTYLSGHLAYINGKCREEKPQNDDYEWYKGWDDAQTGRNRYAAERAPNEAAITMAYLIAYGVWAITVALLPLVLFWLHCE